MSHRFLPTGKTRDPASRRRAPAIQFPTCAPQSHQKTAIKAVFQSDVEMSRNLLNSIKSFMYQWYQYFNDPQNANLNVVLQ